MTGDGGPEEDTRKGGEMLQNSSNRKDEEGYRFMNGPSLLSAKLGLIPCIGCDSRVILHHRPPIAEPTPSPKPTIDPGTSPHLSQTTTSTTPTRSTTPTTPLKMVFEALLGKKFPTPIRTAPRSPSATKLLRLIHHAVKPLGPFFIGGTSRSSTTRNPRYTTMEGK